MKRMILLIVIFLWSSLAGSSQTATPSQNSKGTIRQGQPSSKPSVSRPPAANPGQTQKAPVAKGEAVAKVPAGAQPSKAEPANAGDAPSGNMQPQLKKIDPAEVVQEWFRRWNALDESEESVNRLLELYHADATHEVGPSEKQLAGPIFYEGHRMIRAMAEQFGKTHTELAYYIVQRSFKGTAEIIALGQLPWGATEVVVELAAGYMLKENSKRFMLRGAGFFEVMDGKIRRSRLYIPREEILEVTGSGIP